MQVDSVGGGVDSHRSSHQVTNCMHEHNIPQKGPVKMPSAETQFKTGVEAELKKEMSLADMLRDVVVSTGKRIWGRIWGESAAGNGAAVNGSGGEQTSAGEQLMAQIAEAELTEHAGTSGDSAQGRPNGQAAAPDTAVVMHNPRVAAAATAIQTPQNMLRDNPYFTTSSDPGKVKENIFQKIRVKFQDISKQLTRRFTGTFSGRSEADFHQSSLNSRRQRPKEDLRKRSRYRDKDVEIDCVLTDDSYLMDSYDRKGEYSKLTTEKK